MSESLIPVPDAWRNRAYLNKEQYEAAYAQSVKDPDGYWAQEAARRMLAAGSRGAIVNIASVLGLTPDKGIVAYAAAKAGVVQLTKALALELAFKGIRVNAIAPGWIMTEINHDYLSQGRGAAMKQKIPMGRFGDAQDLDGPLLLLASDAGRYMTGATVIVDGGQVVALPV